MKGAKGFETLLNNQLSAFYVVFYPNGRMLQVAPLLNLFRTKLSFLLFENMFSKLSRMLLKLAQVDMLIVGNSITWKLTQPGTDKITVIEFLPKNESTFEALLHINYRLRNHLAHGKPNRKRTYLKNAGSRLTRVDLSNFQVNIFDAHYEFLNEHGVMVQEPLSQLLPMNQLAAEDALRSELQRLDWIAINEVPFTLTREVTANALALYKYAGSTIKALIVGILYNFVDEDDSLGAADTWITVRVNRLRAMKTYLALMYAQDAPPPPAPATEAAPAQAAAPVPEPEAEPAEAQ